MLTDVKHYPLPIAGARSEGTGHEAVTNPYDGTTVATIAVAGHDDMERAIRAAVEVFPAFSRWPRHKRRDVLRAVVDGLRARKEALVELMIAESGKPRRWSVIEVDRAISTFSIAAEEATRTGGDVLPLDLSPATEGYQAIVERFPAGPVAAIAPFNFPLNLVAHKLGPAFAVGCPVVLKPPVQAPLCALELADICYEAGIPREALSVVHAPIDVAERLATDERFKVLSFTGSARVGWHLKSIAGKKRVLLELGGNAGALVWSDADLDWAAQRCAIGAFGQGGQVCIKVQRILVARDVAETFQAKFLAATDALGVGDPRDESAMVSPMIDAANADRVMAWIEEAKAAGARVLRGGRREGNLIYPTVLAQTTPEMKVECEEIFGPVTTLSVVDDFDHALARINDSRYGLQAGIFTNDIRRAWKAFETLEVGGVVVNDYSTLRVDNFPYGGVKDSGLGREGVRYAMDEMSEPRVLVLKTR
ncbi:MAG TPA: aldehyde dehydrogenase family protein [Candidatus Dormibacteraeota bacterium]|nr:aldehyde dehydrogenase family protein [Candidatus Dormibacteraeota bacterium]